MSDDRELIDRIMFVILLGLRDIPMRYNQIRAALGCSDSTLAKRLRTLREHGLIDIKAVAGSRSYVVYQLTERGQRFVSYHRLESLFADRKES